ncbi:16S rRNA (cytosine967-C5)-methyltransferase [Apibacter mensalis]|uniref:16S rRNA (Cytosine967-C5)-methyltransferase n=1 Tax=Apibacter mensalis TaxID=1586267 RepID=A0A0X3AT51_9FLAO|nr:methyltransferase domain-containing protein [Apibacter mensalis]CVK17048.1 16S rRNA (cytosine967-C5)-methyltransferase [Apibacter mensalis]
MNSKIKLHRNLIIGLHKALEESFFEPNKYADKVLERTLKFNKKWGSKDRGFVSESFYEIIRWKNQLEFFANRKLSPESINVLIATYLLRNKIELQPFPEFEKVYIKKIKDRFKLPFPTLAIKYSIPEWMQMVLESELGDEWSHEMKALNTPAQTIIRANSLKITAEELKEVLMVENIIVNFIKGYKNALIMEEKKNIFKTQAFKDGLFEIQDASSQRVGEFADVKPGMRVIDSCAGAGGKTLHLAALMENKGLIIAMDIHEWKLQTLKQRARRNGAYNIQTKVIEDSKTLKRLENSADRVLIDAPCSGLGVLRRNPDAKWKLNEEFINRVKEEQRQILQNHSKLVRKDGILVYATCSILPSENTLQVEKFLNENSNYQLIEEKKLMPSVCGFDGFYMAKLLRTN